MKNIFFFILLISTELSVSQNDSAAAAEPILTVAEKMPSFPGGEGEMAKFIQKNISFPVPERTAGVNGTCFVRFVVGRDGSISDVKVLRGVTFGPGMDKEAIRVVKLMPKWEPAMQNNRTVNVIYNLPIKFSSRTPESKSSLSDEEKFTSVSNAYYNSGVELAKKGAYEAALDQFDLATKIAPKDVDALYNKGYMLYKLDRKKEACEAWTVLKNLNGKVDESLFSDACK